MPVVVAGTSTASSRDAYYAVLLGGMPPADGPVLGLQSVTPAECTGPIAEIAIPQRATVDVPDDDSAIDPWTDDRVQLQASSALHSPQDDRIGPEFVWSLRHVAPDQSGCSSALQIHHPVDASGAPCNADSSREGTISRAHLRQLGHRQLSAPRRISVSSARTDAAPCRRRARRARA
jgi:hypothetical protein